MAGHTPGPWRIATESSTTRGATAHTLYAGAKYIGSLNEGTDEPALHARGWLPTAEAAANAALIAAATDLLAACELAQKWLANSVPVSEIGGPHPLPVLAAAIAKARGTPLPPAGPPP